MASSKGDRSPKLDLPVQCRHLRRVDVPVDTANGIRVLPDQAATAWPEDQRASTFPDLRPADALDRTLAAITARYGARTTNVVAMQLEYPWREMAR